MTDVVGILIEWAFVKNLVANLTAGVHPVKDGIMDQIPATRRTITVTLENMPREGAKITVISNE